MKYDSDFFKLIFANFNQKIKMSPTRVSESPTNLVGKSIVCFSFSLLIVFFVVTKFIAFFLFSVCRCFTAAFV